ncbi:hypothetical protein [Amycolatopsis sp. NPDC051128]|uniref:hypothetical protein n=1 Tax=Amycolatopsis sp. NPDC051128 TaxID=3155412 RepID=UPI003422B60F
MQSHQAHATDYCRCRYVYALANHVQHPRNVHVGDIVPALDNWLLKAFARAG